MLIYILYGQCISVFLDGTDLCSEAHCKEQLKYCAESSRSHASLGGKPEAEDLCQPQEVRKGFFFFFLK